ncbi:fructosamine kinase family protein [Synechococcus sp. M16CYN]
MATDGPLAGSELTNAVPVGGGCIHQAWQLQLSDGRQIFAKTGPTDAIKLFEVEAEALDALAHYADPDVLIVPQPQSLIQLRHGAVLLLPWLRLEGNNQQSLGHGLALMHQTSMHQGHQYFGWYRDGYIGAGPQPGGWRTSWGQAFVDLRLRPQLNLLKRFGIDAAGLKDFLKALVRHLDQRDVVPALVHGDLWGGNAASLVDGRGTIYDPATWWADPEVDMAMTHLFGGFTESFYRAYYSILPAAPAAEERVEIYNLYHLLNHANLFGGGYVNQVRACLNRLARKLS